MDSAAEENKEVNFEADSADIKDKDKADSTAKDEILGTQNLGVYTFPSEDRTFTANAGDYNVAVTVPAKSFKEKVSLKASDQQWEDLSTDVQNQLKDQGVNKDNSQSLDVRFENNGGKEIEPAKKVNVKITIKDQSLVKDGTDGRLTVYHAEETKNANGEIASVDVKQVASTADESIEIDGKTKAVATFETESFSNIIISGSYSSNNVVLKISHPHIDIKVVYWDYINGQVQNLGSKEVGGTDTPGTDTIRTDNSANGNHTPQYVVIFARPQRGYIVTGATQDVSRVLDENGNPSGTPQYDRFTSVLNFFNNDEKSGDQGGNEWYGFGFDGNGNVRVDQGKTYDFYQGYTLTNPTFGGEIDIYSQPIKLAVNAEAYNSDGSEVSGVQAGNVINFPVTLDPQLGDNVSVESIDSITVKINNMDYVVNTNAIQYVEQGKKYFFTVSNYTVSSEDIISGKVNLDVEATLNYVSNFTTTNKSGKTDSFESRGSVTASTRVIVPISQYTNLEIGKFLDGQPAAKSLAAKWYAGTQQNDGTYKKYFNFNITNAADNDGSLLNGSYTKYDYATSEQSSVPTQGNINFQNGSASFTLGDDERTILQLPTGATYTITETTLDHNQPYSFVEIHSSDREIGTNGVQTASASVTDTLVNDQVVDYYNKLAIGDLFFNKYGEQKDGSDSKLINGATFTLYSDTACQNELTNEAGKAVDTSNVPEEVKPNDTQPELGKIALYAIPVGTYYMKETQAPDGYEVDSTIYTVHINENSDDGTSRSYITDPSGNKVTNITDRLIRRNIIIRKVDQSDTDKILTGAEFTLEKSGIGESGAAVSTSGIDANGKLSEGSEDDAGTYTITGLPVGTYTLTETKAPDGYIFNNTGKKLEITADSVTYDSKIITAKNGVYVITIMNKAGQALPNTGGHGTLPFVLGGMFLISAAGMLYIISKKRSALN